MKQVGNNLQIRVRLTPKARRNAVLGWAQDRDDLPYLKVSVTAVPEDDKANKALIALLAEEWGIARSRVSIVKGRADKNKILEIKGLDNDNPAFHEIMQSILS